MAIVNINKQLCKANDQYLGVKLRLCYFSRTEQNNKYSLPAKTVKKRAENS